MTRKYFLATLQNMWRYLSTWTTSLSGRQPTISLKNLKKMMRTTRQIRFSIHECSSFSQQLIRQLSLSSLNHCLVRVPFTHYSNEIAFYSIITDLVINPSQERPRRERNRRKAIKLGPLCWQSQVQSIIKQCSLNNHTLLRITFS